MVTITQFCRSFGLAGKCSSVFMVFRRPRFALARVTKASRTRTAGAACTLRSKNELQQASSQVWGRPLSLPVAETEEDVSRAARPEPPCLRTMLFLKRDKKIFRSAHLSGSDCLVIDMEDAVPPNMKDEARRELREALLSPDSLACHEGQSLGLRVNPLSTMKELVADCEQLLLPKLNILVLPKVDSSACMRAFDNLVTEYEKRNGLSCGHITFVPILETPLSFFNTLEIAASRRVVGLVLGLEDFCADTNSESTYANPAAIQLCARTVLAARACGVQAVGPALLNLDNYSLAEKIAERDRQMGFVGKPALNLPQTHLFHREFSVNDQDIAWAENTLTSRESSESAKQTARETLARRRREKELDKRLFSHIHDEVEASMSYVMPTAG